MLSCAFQETAVYGEHIWFETNVSGDFCYVGEQNCMAKLLVSRLGSLALPACSSAAGCAATRWRDHEPGAGRSGSLGSWQGEEDESLCAAVLHAQCLPVLPFSFQQESSAELHTAAGHCREGFLGSHMLSGRI